MYKLPKNFDGRFLLGRVLEFVTFSENNISLAFDQQVNITIASSFSHQPGPQEKAISYKLPIWDSSLMLLLGHTIIEVKGLKDGTLVIVFDNGHVLSVYDDSECYESYSIFDGRNQMIV